MTKSLKQKTILVTRPKHQAESLCHHIKQHQGNVLLLPSMTIHEKPIAKHLISLSKNIQENDIAIFLSANAVIHSQHFWQQANRTPHIIAIGTGTAAALKQTGLPVTAMPAQQNSEGLLQLPLLKQARQRTIYLFCGTNNRELLQQQLCQHNTVIAIACYYRQAAELNDSTRKTLQTATIDYIVTTSQAVLQAFYQLLLRANATALLQKTLVVIDPKQLILAKTLGFTKILVANNAQGKSIVATISRDVAGNQ